MSVATTRMLAALTLRERDVANLLKSGRSPAGVARSLGLTGDEVEDIIDRIDAVRDACTEQSIREGSATLGSLCLSYIQSRASGQGVPA